MRLSRGLQIQTGLRLCQPKLHRGPGHKAQEHLELPTWRIRLLCLSPRDLTILRRRFEVSGRRSLIIRQKRVSQSEGVVPNVLLRRKRANLLLIR
jgi:hypothetical protein